MIKPLTKLDVSRYHYAHPWIAGFIAAGFRFKVEGHRVWLVK